MNFVDILPHIVKFSENSSKYSKYWYRDMLGRFWEVNDFEKYQKKLKIMKKIIFLRINPKYLKKF